MAAFAARLPDLAVIDISLEEEPEGGFELCRELRSLSAELPIIFLTARESELDAVSGLRLGSDDFLTNDLSLAHLIARFFFFNDTATTEIYTLSLHDALPI